MNDLPWSVFGQRAPPGDAEEPSLGLGVPVDQWILHPMRPMTSAEINLLFVQQWAVALGLTPPRNHEICRYGVISIDRWLLNDIMPRLPVKRASEFTPWMQKYLFGYSIDTIPRISAFIGNTAVESEYYTELVENVDYTSPARLKDVFPNEFPTLKIAQHYVGQPEAIANRAYAGRLGNGSEQTGDGWRYRGRGIIQVSGRAEYQEFAKFSGVDVVSDPDLMAQPQYSVWSAVWFWQKNNLNRYADLYQYLALAERINPARPPLGWRDREAIRKRAAHIIAQRLLGHGAF